MIQEEEKNQEKRDMRISAYTVWQLKEMDCSYFDYLKTLNLVEKKYQERITPEEKKNLKSEALSKARKIEEAMRAGNFKKVKVNLNA